MMMMQRLRHAGRHVGLSLALTALALNAFAAPSPTQRETTLGAVLGADDSASTGTYAWKGVPYAKPPVGALRWKAPVDAEPWTSVKTTQQFGNACASSGRLYGPGLNNRYDATIGTSYDKTVGSEDCLYLNIWRPATEAKNLPVIVWVHGGSNVTGYTADPVYDGATLAKTANVIVVSVNYRLGVLGFFKSAQLKTGDAVEDSGNFALLDLIKSLQFVNKNIANFGGDAGNVTLMGQSAGSVNVWALITSPLVVKAKPALVHRLVPLSGGIARAEDVPARVLPALVPPAMFETQANLLLTHFVLADGLAKDKDAAQIYIASRTAEQNASYLRSKSADAVLSAVLTTLKAANLGGSNPIPDGTVLPTNPTQAIKAGQYLKVPVLVGNTRDEVKLFPGLLVLLGAPSGRLLTDPEAFAIAMKYDPNAAPATKLTDWIPSSMLPTKTPGTGFNARTDLLNAYWFIPGRDSAINALKTQQNNIWVYRFDWDQEPAPFNEIFGAAHGFDLPFLFGNFGPSTWSNFANSEANKPGRLELSNAMMRSLGAFALKGDPNDASLGTTWPVWPKVLLFNASRTAKAITVQ